MNMLNCWSRGLNINEQHHVCIVFSLDVLHLPKRACELTTKDGNQEQHNSAV